MKLIISIPVLNVVFPKIVMVAFFPHKKTCLHGGRSKGIFFLVNFLPMIAAANDQYSLDIYLHFHKI